jgi:glycosyltransferase 2 family protein
MTNKTNNWQKYIPVLLAAALLYLAFRGVKWAEILDTFRKARLEFLLLAFIIQSSSFFIRSLRWRTLLKVEKPISVINIFWATMIGYLGNNLLPARAGELIRTWALGNKTGLSKTFIIGTILVERGMDVVFLVLIGLVSLNTLSGLPVWMPNAIKSLTVLGFILLVGILLAPRMEKFIIQLINRMHFLLEVMRARIILFTQKLLN